MTGHFDDAYAAPAERTFTALPPARGRGFARTWWGQAWLKALEDSALDGEQVKQGRRHARAGAVGAVTVRPGRITALVQDRDHTRHRVDVLLHQLGSAAWDRFLDLVADRAGHIAALLDREVPPALAEDASAAGIDLLPGIGELESECGCGAWDHCAHSAALCYQVARLLDQDPFVLLLLRGRGERELLDELQARSAAHAEAPAGAGTGQAAAGVSAAEAYAARDVLPPLPAPPPPVTAPAAAPALGGGTPPAPGLDVPALEFLIGDAAARARRLLADALSPGHPDVRVPAPLTEAQDAVRLAAARPGARIAARLAAGSGRGSQGLATAVRAWEQGGAAGLSVLDEEWTPDAATLARATAQLAAAWGEEGSGPPRGRGNRWTLDGGSAQLRYGRDGRWWPYRAEHGQWVPAGPADEDPAGALAVLLDES
ncbi:putative helicase [Streptomyces sp. NBRC 110611]|uniref:SWIM zinc finger family protein n=1 Tax=Streptomyces sp. NBRC 110611 TaxID=1621259 RepID=UPI0008313D9C|nr:SWF or SNF family helicase [Streptomyces sp. NBRC 110611]GAU69098.1 putative helicase [Streptomyces sp. NBRC 110611]